MANLYVRSSDIEGEQKCVLLRGGSMADSKRRCPLDPAAGYVLPNARAREGKKTRIFSVDILNILIEGTII